MTLRREILQAILLILLFAFLLPEETFGPTSCGGDIECAEWHCTPGDSKCFEEVY